MKLSPVWREYSKKSMEMCARLAWIEAGPGRKALIMSSSSRVPIAGSHCRAAPSAGWQTEKPLKAAAEPCWAMPAIGAVAPVLSDATKTGAVE